MPTLNELWKFDEADLNANRKGNLTEPQKKALVEQYKSQPNALGGLAAAAAVLFICLPALVFSTRIFLPMTMLSSAAEQTSAADSLGRLGASFLGMAGLIALAAGLMYALRWVKPVDMTVKTARGKISYAWETQQSKDGKETRVFFVSVGDEKFQTDESLQSALKAGEVWTVYYTAKPFRFLSAEKS